MSVSPTLLSISSLLYTREDHNAMYLPIKISSDNGEGIEIVKGLLDSRASGKFIDQDFAQDIHAEKKDLEKPIQVYNVDGTLNKRGTITQYVELELEIHKRKRKHRLLVTGLGNQQIILGFTWLKEMNPLIDWKKGTLEWRRWKHSVLKKQPKESKTIEYYTFAQNTQQRSNQEVKPVTMTTEEDEEKCINHTRNPLEETELSMIISTITGNTEDSIWINSKTTTATTTQTEINLKKEVLPVEKQIPEEFHEFLDVFSEEKAAQFPKPQQWDHKIEMKDTFVPKLFKMYNLTPQEQTELDKFLKENLEKGYI